MFGNLKNLYFLAYKWNKRISFLFELSSSVLKTEIAYEASKVSTLISFGKKN